MDVKIDFSSHRSMSRLRPGRLYNTKFLLGKARPYAYCLIFLFVLLVPSLDDDFGPFLCFCNRNEAKMGRRQKKTTRTFALDSSLGSRNERGLIA